MNEFDRPTDFSEIDETKEPCILIAGHFFERDNYFAKRPRGMNDWLITYTIDGIGYIRTPNYVRTNKSGDITLLRPGIPHEYGTQQGHTWNFMWAHFSSQLMETRYFSEDELIIDSIENVHVRQRIISAFTRVIEDYRERGQYWDKLCQNSLREILLLIARRNGNKMDPRIEQALHALSERMQQQIRVEDLAKLVGLSTSRLSHLFKENIGDSIVETLNNMRLQEAAQLLRHTDRNASEIALHVGFQSYHHFAIQFRKRYGMSPTSFKARD